MLSVYLISPSANYNMRRWTGSILIQVMAFHLWHQAIAWTNTELLERFRYT